MGIAAEERGAFAGLLRRYRESASLTQEELAERSGLTSRAISDMERGRTTRPYLSSVRLLADALELSGQDRVQLTAAARAQPRPDLPDEPALHPAGRRGPAWRPAVLPRQLPPAVRHFAGRADKLTILNGLLDGLGTPGGAAVICVITGTAGAGKTALATHWAHQAAGRFPDGQLYVNLRGFDPRSTPVTPAEAVRGFLDAFEVPPARIPASFDGQVGLYRSIVADRRMLVLLDNVRDMQQVRPLLPSGPHCLALITSRSQLTGLIATEGARPLMLDVLSEPDAQQLLAEFIGPQRIAAQQEAAAALIQACARLPLALAIAAARAAVRADLPLAELAGELRDSARPLDALDGGDPFSSVRAVTSWSYRLLTEPAARMFRLLGVHPGADISAAAAASLAGVPPERAGQLLDELTGFHLLTERAPGRYASHDLLRSYAAEQSVATDSPADRQAAVRRMLDHYLHTAHAAELLISRSRPPIALARPLPRVTPEPLSGAQAAMTWFSAEREVLQAAVTLATELGLDSYGWQIPWAVAKFLDRLGHWEEGAASQRIALAAAERLGDDAAQAHARLSLGRALGPLGRGPESYAQLTMALEIYRQLGDATGQANTHMASAVTRYRQDEVASALSHARQALELFQQTGDRAAQANALNSIGFDHALLGNGQAGLDYCQQALDLCRALGARAVEAETLDSPGFVQLTLGHHDEAAGHYWKAYGVFGDLDHRGDQARVLTNLGDAELAFGATQAAVDAWQRAIAIFDELQHPGAELARGKLRDLRWPEAAGHAPAKNGHHPAGA